MSEYDRGFNDALRIMADAFKQAADTVEKDKTGEVTRQSDGKKFVVTMATGDVCFAHRLRAIALDMERLMS